MKVVSPFVVCYHRERDGAYWRQCMSHETFLWSR